MSEYFKNNKASGCRLCNALAGDENYLYNIPIYNSNFFVLLPCIGPIIHAHIMIVSKNHYMNLLMMPSDAIVEYETLVRTINVKLCISGKSLLEMEHGSTAQNPSGSSIDHMHVHWMPTTTTTFELLSEKLDCTKVESLRDIAITSNGYFFIRHNNRLRVVIDPHVESQFLRRKLAEIFETEWDWTKEENKEMVSQNIAFWRTLVDGI